MPWTTSDPMLHFQVTGQGPTLVLAHEMGGSSWSWRKVVERLAPSFTVISYDQQGAGLSEKPRMAFGPEALVQDLGHVIDATGQREPVFLAGAAAGAAVAAGFALAYAERVRALALCAPALGVEPAAREGALTRAALVAREGMAAVADLALTRIYPEVLRDEDFVEYRARFLAHDPVGFALLNRAFAGTDLDAAGICAPCLVLAGRHDVRPVEDIVHLAAVIPNAEFAVIEQGGHVMAHQASEAVANRLAAFFLPLARQL